VSALPSDYEMHDLLSAAASLEHLSCDALLRVLLHVLLRALCEACDALRQVCVGVIARGALSDPRWRGDGDDEDDTPLTATSLRPDLFRPPELCSALCRPPELCYGSCCLLSR